jgi:glycyl-tRNA synthetase beta subunit
MTIIKYTNDPTNTHADPFTLRRAAVGVPFCNPR